MDDEEPVVGLGRDGVVQEGEHGDLLAAGQHLDVGQLLDVVVGEDNGVQLGEALVQFFADATEKWIRKAIFNCS